LKRRKEARRSLHQCSKKMGQNQPRGLRPGDVCKHLESDGARRLRSETPLPGRGGRSRCRFELGCIRRFRLCARVALAMTFQPSLPHRSGLADFPHPARRVQLRSRLMKTMLCSCCRTPRRHFLCRLPTLCMSGKCLKRGSRSILRRGVRDARRLARVGGEGELGQQRAGVAQLGVPEGTEQQASQRDADERARQHFGGTTPTGCSDSPRGGRAFHAECTSTGASRPPGDRRDDARPLRASRQAVSPWKRTSSSGWRCRGSRSVTAPEAAYPAGLTTSTRCCSRRPFNNGCLWPTLHPFAGLKFLSVSPYPDSTCPSPPSQKSQEAQASQAREPRR
jgi:hypothetical protein